MAEVLLASPGYWESWLWPCYLLTDNACYLVLVFTSYQAIREYQPLPTLLSSTMWAPNLGILAIWILNPNLISNYLLQLHIIYLSILRYCVFPDKLPTDLAITHCITLESLSWNNAALRAFQERPSHGAVRVQLADSLQWQSQRGHL